MLKLTEKQIELAEQAYKSQDGAFTGSVIGGILLAAPFLQLPWDGPTEDEARHVWSGNRHIVPEDKMVENCISAFVNYRNARLMPKPVDPRRETVLRAIRSLPHTRFGLEGEVELTDAILSALDEVK